MPFSDIYKSPKSPLSRLRHQRPEPLQPRRSDDGWDPDLFSRDKAKQKDAVKRYLEENIRADWNFEWPPQKPESQAAPGPAPSSSPGDKTKEQEQQKEHHDYDAAPAGALDNPLAEGSSQPAVDPMQPSSNPIVPTAEATTATTPVVPAATSTTTEALAALTDPAPKVATEHDVIPPAPEQETNTLPLSAFTSALAPPADIVVSRDPGYDVDTDGESDYSTMSEDAGHFRPRQEWESGDNTDEDDINYASSPIRISSPFRFDSPDSVGADIQAMANARLSRRRRALREEMSWNNGLACFEARRNAWSGAKTIRLKPTVVAPVSPVIAAEKPLSPLSPRRLFMRDRITHPATLAASPAAIGMVPLALHGSQSSAESVNGGGVFSVRDTTSKDTNTSSASDDPTADPSSSAAAAAAAARRAARKRYPIVTVLPRPRPLLPPDNPMRASITPSAYASIYDKIVGQSMTPSCPVNLADMVSACVAGWKRRGEWPPRVTAPESALARKRAKRLAQQQLEAQQLATVVVAGPASPAYVPVSRAPAVQYPEVQAQMAPQQTPMSPSALARPPGPSIPPQIPAKSESRRKSFSFLSREKSKDSKEETTGIPTGRVSMPEETGKSFRRSLQKVLGWHHPHHHLQQQHQAQLAHARGASLDGSVSANAAVTGVAAAALAGGGASGSTAGGGANASAATVPTTLTTTIVMTGMERKADPAPAVVTGEHARGRSSADLLRNGNGGEGGAEGGASAAVVAVTAAVAAAEPTAAEAAGGDVEEVAKDVQPQVQDQDEGQPQGSVPAAGGGGQAVSVGGS